VFPIRNKNSVVNSNLSQKNDNDPKRVSPLMEEIKSTASVQQNKQKALLEKNKVVLKDLDSFQIRSVTQFEYYV
jgi:hypothetical protein